MTKKYADGAGFSQSMQESKLSSFAFVEAEMVVEENLEISNSASKQPTKALNRPQQVYGEIAMCPPTVFSKDAI